MNDDVVDADKKETIIAALDAEAKQFEKVFENWGEKPDLDTGKCKEIMVWWLEIVAVAPEAVLTTKRQMNHLIYKERQQQRDIADKRVTDCIKHQKDIHKLDYGIWMRDQEEYRERIRKQFNTIVVFIVSSVVLAVIVAGCTIRIGRLNSDLRSAKEDYNRILTESCKPDLAGFGRLKP